MTTPPMPQPATQATIYECPRRENHGDPDAPGRLEWNGPESFEGDEMRWYDGWYEIDGWPAAWYCDDCLEGLYAALGFEEGAAVGTTAFDVHLSEPLHEYLRKIA